MPPKKKPNASKQNNTSRIAGDRQCVLYEILEKFIIWGGVLTAIVLGSVAIHRINGHIHENEVSTLSQHSKYFDMPENSMQVSDHIYEVQGEHHKRGNVTGLFILHYEDESNRQPSNTKRSKMEGYEATVSGTCYAAYAKGAKWKSKERFLIDYSNNQGLSSNYIQTVFQRATDAWNDADSFGDIFGVQDTVNTAQGIDLNNPDGRNEVHFGYLNEPGVLAITIVWGVFNGQESQREIFEWDQIYNEHYQWGDSNQDPSLNDLQNTVTHELGHSSGLRDIYDSGCSHVTMYGYAAAGETKKRTLSTDDVKGINSLYKSSSGSSPSSPHGVHTNPAQDEPNCAFINTISFCLINLLWVIAF